VLRGVFILVCMLFAFQASGLASAIAPPECREGCPDDDAKGHCPPACACCGCCAHPAPLAAVRPSPTVIPVNPADTAIWVDEQPASTDPHEIVHVPKSPAV
jgi:hypothetical protein